MRDIFSGVGTILFCDETKFYINDGDLEDEIYYFAVSVPVDLVSKIDRDFKIILSKYNVQAAVYHSTNVFKESRTRDKLMNELVQLIIQNKLNCFCYKYSKALFFESTKSLVKFNNDIIDFNKTEFQAVFYFLIVLNTLLRDQVPDLLKKEIVMYFDRNVYGVNEVEAFNFPSDHFILKRMTFSEKSLVSLLSLPDFFGYIFRKSKKSQNKVQGGDITLETSKLAINSYNGILEITEAGLFHFIDVDKNILDQALNAFD